MMNGEQVAKPYLYLLVSFGQVMVSVRPVKSFAILGGSLQPEWLKTSSLLSHQAGHGVVNEEDGDVYAMKK